MKLPSILAALGLAAQPLLAAEPAKTAEPRSPRVLLQEALFAEEAERDLEKASAGYAEMLVQFEAQRTLAATALYHLAEIRAKQKKSAEAIALHQRLVAEFAKEEALAKLSGDRLAQLGAAALAVTGVVTEAISAKEADELARLRRMVKDSPDLLDTPDENGFKPLVTAASSGWAQATAFLLDQRVAINGGGSWVPLHWAAQYGRKRTIELLLERGADVNATGHDGWTALQAAVYRNYMEVARVLLEHGAKPDMQVKPSYRNTYTAKEAGTPPEGTPLVVAATKGSLEMFKLLLDKGADPNLASLENEVTPLGAAAEAGRVEMVQLLLERKAKIDHPQKGLTPLMAATQKNHLEVVKLLLKSGARVDLADETGATALHYAAATAEPLVEVLLAAGASPKAVTKSGLTPLHCTVLARSLVQQASGRINLERPERQDVPVASLPKIWDELVARGADLNAADASGYTLLHYASGVSELSAKDIAQLVQRGANPEAKSKEGQLPFLYAVSPKREELERAIVFPKLAQQRAISLLDRWNGNYEAPKTLEPASQEAEPPSWEELLKKFSIKPPLGNQLRLTVYRKDAGGEIKEAGSREEPATGEAPAPLQLQWGDVVVMSSVDINLQRRPRVVYPPK